MKSVYFLCMLVHFWFALDKKRQHDPDDPDEAAGGVADSLGGRKVDEIPCQNFYKELNLYNKIKQFESSFAKIHENFLGISEYPINGFITADMSNPIVLY